MNSFGMLDRYVSRAYFVCKEKRENGKEIKQMASLKRSSSPVYFLVVKRSIHLERLSGAAQVSVPNK